MNSKRKACFICGTPFHVFSSIIIKNQMKIDADIIIYDAFENIDKLTDSLVQEGVFDNVRIINKEKEYKLPQNLFCRYIYTFLGYFRIRNLVEKVIPKISNYSDVFFANAHAVDVIDRFNYCYIKKYYPEIKLHYIEEGWDSYDEKYYDLTNLDYFFRKYIVRGKTHILDMTIHSYSLELYDRINPNKKRKVVQIQKPQKEDVVLLKKVFSYYTNIDLSSYDIIIIDTVRTELFSEEGSRKFNEIVEDIVGDKRVIVKSHPRESDKFFDYKYFETGGFPFEILCLYNNFDNTVFVNNDSCAVFFPKLIFDQEPTLIFTYKRLEKYMKDTATDKDLVMQNFRLLYKDKSKIVVLD